jgi:flavodoxin
MDKKVAVIYHSGSGSTRTVSEVLTDKLSQHCKTDLIPVSPDFDYRSLNGYDFLLFGFPTYSCNPSRSMQEFIDKFL